MPKHESTALRGRVIHLIYSPKGGIEGVLLQTSEGDAQLVLEKDDKVSAKHLLGVAADDMLDAMVEKMPPSKKGPSPHRMYRLVRLGGSDSKPGRKNDAGAAGIFNGRVVRFNYARHGEPNGVVLDSGHFIHTKPDGMKQVGLGIGKKIEAEGDARALVHGDGFVVEAHRVNGIELRKGKPRAEKALKAIMPATAKPTAKKAVKKVAKKVVKKAAKKIVKKR